MGVNSNIIKTNSLLSIFGIVLLLLISPCKVRNFVQAEIDVPQTEVSNKSKSSVSKSKCQSLVISKKTQTISKPSFEQPEHFLSAFIDLELAIDSLNDSFKLYTSQNQLNAEIPLYILYQNLKVHT